MLKIKKVSASIDTTHVLNNINLTINAGEIHALIGPRRSGKSVLAHIIQGNPYITVNEGSITFKGKSIGKLQAHQRSKLGIFVSFQHPVPIDGLTNFNLIKSLVETKLETNFNSEIDNAYKILSKTLGLDRRFGDDTVNNSIRPVEDSKKSELLQMLMLRPELIILDEIDEDMEEESLEYAALMIKNYIETNSSTALVIITHNHNFLDKITPHYVHVMVDGQIREEGTTELYKRILEDGYSQFSQS